MFFLGLIFIKSLTLSFSIFQKRIISISMHVLTVSTKETQFIRNRYFQRNFDTKIAFKFNVITLIIFIVFIINDNTFTLQNP